MDVRRVADRGLLVDADRPVPLAAWVRQQPRAAELVEVVPAATTVYLEGPATVLQWFASALAELVLPADGPAAEREVTLDVVYDGPDLERVAERAGVAADAVGAAHSGQAYTVGFFGFSPGQPFLGDLPEPLRVPRLDSPRTRVPAAALGVANRWCTIYPRSSPGGWHLIGRYVGPPLWDGAADPPNRLRLGDRVRFRSVS